MQSHRGGLKENEETGDIFMQPISWKKKNNVSVMFIKEIAEIHAL